MSMFGSGGRMVKQRLFCSLHGVAEHIARYDDFARFMAENGFVTVGNDHLGHGKTVKSEADLCYFSKDAGWTHVVDDMHTLMLTEKEKYPTIPYFILGHSMGSFLTRTLLIRYPKAVDGAILSGTGYTPKPMIVLGLAVAAIEARKIGDRGRSELLNKHIIKPLSRPKHRLTGSRGIRPFATPISRTRFAAAYRRPSCFVKC